MSCRHAATRPSCPLVWTSSLTSSPSRTDSSPSSTHSTTRTWNAPSGAIGWSVADVVLHLAQTEEAVVASVAGRVGISNWRSQADNLDDAVDQMVVSAERTTPQATFERWRIARRAAVAAMMNAGSRSALPMGGDATEAKDARDHAIGRALGARTRHHATARRPVPRYRSSPPHRLARARNASVRFCVRGPGSHPVFCELTAPDGSTWRYGPADASSSITGEEGAFCRVGACAPRAGRIRTRGSWAPRDGRPARPAQLRRLTPRPRVSRFVLRG